MPQHEDYTVGWICALPKEQTAAIAMLDERHARLPKPPSDSNTYTLGSIGEHNIVIACLPMGMYGTIPAATVAANMTTTFPSIRFGLLVGIGGGVPPKVRLGDVVVSVPHGVHPGVVQWDMGKTEQGSAFRRTGVLNNQPTSLLAALSALESDRQLGISEISSHLEKLGLDYPILKEKYLKSNHLKDVLFDKDYAHQGGTSDCKDCAKDRMIDRGPENFTVHFGVIASGNQVIKDAAFREALVKDLGEVLCIEMEAAGLMNNFPCIVIRGICDYADSHKNKAWQEHAAAVAAAFAKDLLGYVMADEVTAEKAAKDVLSQISQTVTIISAATTETQQLLKNKEDTNVLNWVSPNDYGSEQNEALKRWHPETCRWFLSSQQYQTWLEAQGRTLYCPGIPGAGKTIMSAAVIHNISVNPSTNSSVGLAYVYFTFSRQREQTGEHVLASLLMQFLRKQASVPNFVRDIYEHHKRSGMRATREELMNMLSPVILQYERAYIVLDALDECTTENQCRTEILSNMLALQVSASVNILVTSRENEEIVSMLKQRETATSILPIRAQDGDVGIFLHRQLETQDADVFDGPIRKLVASKVTQMAKGMFLLARLHINTIVEIPTKKKVKIALEGLAAEPVGLHAVYEQTMNRIKSQAQGRKNMAILTLLWIVHARRPLSTRELQHALGVDPSSLDVDEDDIPSIRVLKSVCAGLVQVEEGSNVVGLIHYTTQEFFEKTQATWFPDAQRYITQNCVAYLSFPSLSGYCYDDRDFETRLKTYPFYDYAAHEWGHHARTIPTEPRVVAFLQRREAIEGSIQSLMVDSYFKLLMSQWSQQFPKGMNGLHLAAFFGLHNAVEELFDSFDVNEVDSYHRTPLVLAVRHSEVVKLLLKTGQIDLNVADNYGRTALSHAAKGGHSAVVKLLLETGKIDLNVTDDYGRTALSFAAEGGPSKVVKLLLETEEIDANVADMYNRTALSYAAEGGHSDVVKLLLETEYIHVNVADKYDRTALLLAAGGGHSEVVKLLLKTGKIYVNAVDYKCRTALLGAAAGGHSEVVKLLLETEEIDINEVDNEGNTALLVADRGSYSEVVKLLVETGKIDVTKSSD